jgi:hypothetical protein
MTYRLVLDLAADGIPVAVTCGLLGFSRQAFYSWRADPVSERDLVDAYATNAALEVHRDDPGFGYRFIADELTGAGARHLGAAGVEGVLPGWDRVRPCEEARQVEEARPAGARRPRRA